MVRPALIIAISELINLFGLILNRWHFDNHHLLKPLLALRLLPSLLSNLDVKHCGQVGTVVDMEVAAVPIERQVPWGESLTY